MSEGHNIFIVEDDPNIRFGLEEVFRSENYSVASCGDGSSALEQIGEHLPDLIVLDVMLPGKNGYEICKELREGDCRIPILMLTAKGQEIDKVIGLDSGADDYVTKPFGVQELKARVSALLRRSGNWQSPGIEVVEDFTVGNATICETTYESIVDGEAHRLTPKEMELLKFFHANEGKVLSRDQLLNAVWGVKYFGTTRTLDQCVAQLRKKIGDTGKKPEYLVTVHGVGYQLNRVNL
ncbi:MAG: response regulator transcription factor [Verrucomicrobiales bacterium]|nr:response regulator transcription factor [Verrucomicrobiales bacterium]